MTSENQEAEAIIPAKVLRLRYKDSFGNSVSESTWNRWLEPIRDIVPRYTKMYNPLQKEAIYKLLGEP